MPRVVWVLQEGCVATQSCHPQRRCALLDPGLAVAAGLVDVGGDGHRVMAGSAEAQQQPPGQGSCSPRLLLRAPDVRGRPQATPRQACAGSAGPGVQPKQEGQAPLRSCAPKARACEVLLPLPHHYGGRDLLPRLPRYLAAQGLPLAPWCLCTCGSVSVSSRRTIGHTCQRLALGFAGSLPRRLVAVLKLQPPACGSQSLSITTSSLETGYHAGHGGTCM